MGLSSSISRSPAWPPVAVSASSSSPESRFRLSELEAGVGAGGDNGDVDDMDIEDGMVDIDVEGGTRVRSLSVVESAAGSGADAGSTG